ncbi:MAG: GntR family transcriptional regulator [Pseudomonadota bacterium]|nr:GntR family transcriptional regulator [Pseudomonadota bacterium]
MAQKPSPLRRGGSGATMVERLTTRLAESIVSGKLTPGTRLDEQGLADRYGISRTPVREAIGQLVAMGMLEKRPHRGAIVATVTVERLIQMFEVMAEVEAACARLCAERMTLQERQALAKLHQDGRSAVERDDQEAYEDLNRQFHTMIYRGTHNDLLVETALEARRRVAPYRRAQFNVTGRVGLSWDEHDAVVDAIIDGQDEAAYRAMRRHILTVKDASTDYVAKTLNLGTDAWSGK